MDGLLVKMFPFKQSYCQDVTYMTRPAKIKINRYPGFFFDWTIREREGYGT